ncbi:hypothetical protein PoB_000479700 [Plakobranchus ocellatus]|uniref:Uncharacterized protein n=1 Tax=Plakobranchus ocellatus TaxID=259542 RepID=A0AAV3Y845_9GAST|nr:hypothetical protein PoB_000479700 [Plakobranchus ocellatus]
MYSAVKKEGDNGGMAKSQSGVLHLAGDHPGGWPKKPVSEILWRRDGVAMTTAAKIMRKFLHAVSRRPGSSVTRQSDTHARQTLEPDWRPPETL